MVWAMLSLVAEDCVLGLSRDWESIDGPARVEGAIDLEAAAVCRSRAERAADAIFAQAVRRVAITIDGGGCGLGMGVVRRLVGREDEVSSSSKSGVWRGCHYQVAEAKPTWSSASRSTKVLFTISSAAIGLQTQACRGSDTRTDH